MNIKLLGGKPLIAWSIETAFKSGIDRVIVSTDSEEYGKIIKEYSAEFMLRPSSVAGDKTSMYETLKSEVFKISQGRHFILQQKLAVFGKNRQARLRWL